VVYQRADPRAVLWVLDRKGASRGVPQQRQVLLCAQRAEPAEALARQVAVPEFVDAWRGAPQVELLASAASSGEALLSAGVASSRARAPVLAPQRRSSQLALEESVPSGK